MIGVFDSGIGGLTVHRALVEHLPYADFVYLADQANTPYGGRTPEEIVNLTREGCMRLLAEGATLIVLACNTAAAIALRPLQEGWLAELRRQRVVNVIGIIVPTIEAAAGMAKPATVGVFATPATVRSGVYATEIHKCRPDIAVHAESCPELARMIEAGASRVELQVVIERHVSALSARIGATPWQAILGCTHYEIVGDLFARALPAGVQLIHQPTSTARALADYLKRHPEYDTGASGLRRFITTGASLQSALAREFWGGELAFKTLLAT